MQFVPLLFLLHTSCAKKQQRIALADLLPQQISSIPIGMNLSDFETEHPADYERITLGDDLVYLKKNIDSPDVMYVQYQFQKSELKEVLIGYKAFLGAQDVATSLYGPPNDEGRWLATNSNNSSVVIEIFDNKIIYR